MSASTNNKDLVIDLGSNLTIDCVKELQQVFIAMSNSKSEIEFESELIDTIDLAGIQFLVFASKIAAEKGIELKHKFDFSEAAKDLLAKTGFLNLLGN